ncbi:hypothetical protein C2845_PM01G20430 [Panicum miliaceum]|uniref:Uncharacterized protein n=1 Tax=Panicum miliaceum TaxID=4540 RepID=A0A3L6TVH7_PANMI|nr:hypothetical protein C2845_PM01G20430 [Panicum miliaceum]
MHGCFFRFGSPRRQALHGGGVTVVSRGDGGGVRAKVVVSGAELERIAAAVARKQRGGPAAAACRRRITAVPPPRSEPEEEEEAASAGVARGGGWRPALDGIPEDA